MTDIRDPFIGHLERYLDEHEGSTTLPESVRNAVRAGLPSTRQYPAWWPVRRSFTMNMTVKLVAAAAAVTVAAILGYSYFVAPNVGEPSPSPSQSTPSPSSAPAGLPVFDDQPQGENVAAGTYLITEVEPLTITATIPDGWQKVQTPGLLWGDGARLHFTTVTNIYADPCDRGLGVLDPAPGPTVEDLVAAFSAVPGLEATAATAVTVDGFSGQYLELTAVSDWDGCTGDAAPLWPMFGFSEDKPAPIPGERLLLWIVDVDGERLVIAGRITADVTPEAEAELQSIVESIQLDAP